MPVETASYQDLFLDKLAQTREEQEKERQRIANAIEGLKTTLTPVLEALQALETLGVARNGQALRVMSGPTDTGYTIRFGWEGDPTIRWGEVRMDYEQPKVVLFMRRGSASHTTHAPKDLDWIIDQIYTSIAIEAKDWIPSL